MFPESAEFLAEPQEIIADVLTYINTSKNCSLLMPAVQGLRGGRMDAIEWFTLIAQCAFAVGCLTDLALGVGVASLFFGLAFMMWGLRVGWRKAGECRSEGGD